MKNLHLNKAIRFQKGYTLLFAVLTATLVLGVAIFILSVSRKQFILSATARDSMFAFYAADSGIECGTVVINNPLYSTSNANLSCNGVSNNYTFDKISSVSSNSHVDPSLQLTDTTGFPVSQIYQKPVLLSSSGINVSCALITITDGTTTTGTHIVALESRGYNNCDTTGGNAGRPKTSDSQTVERAIQLVK